MSDASETGTEPSRVRVRILRPFRLNREDGTWQVFTPDGTNCGEPGLWDVTLEDADHWYVRLHSDHPPELPPPPPGSPAAAEILARENTERLAREAARATIEQGRVNEGRRKRADEVRRALGKTGGDFEQPPIG